MTRTAVPRENPDDRVRITAPQREELAERVAKEKLRLVDDVKRTVRAMTPGVTTGNMEEIIDGLAGTIIGRGMERVADNSTQESLSRLMEEVKAEGRRQALAIKNLIHRTAGSDRKLSEVEMRQLGDLLRGLDTVFQLPEDVQKLYEVISGNQDMVEEKDLTALADLFVASTDKSKGPTQFQQCAYGLMFHMLKPENKIKVSKKIIDKDPTHAEDWIKSVTVGSELTVVEAQQLWRYAESKGIKMNQFDEKTLMEMQAEAKQALDDNIRMVRRGGDANEAHNMLSFASIGKVALVIWGALEVAINTAANWDHKSELMENAYFWGGLAGMVGGYAGITGKLPGQDFLTQPSLDEKKRTLRRESRVEANRIIGANVDLKTYLDAGGYSQIRAAHVKKGLAQEGKTEKDFSISLEDLLAIETNPIRKAALVRLKTTLPVQGKADVNKILEISVGIGIPYKEEDTELGENAFRDFLKEKDVPDPKPAT